MNIVTHYFELSAHEVDDKIGKSMRFDTVEVDFNEYKRIDKIIVDGNDLTFSSAKELMRALITSRNLQTLMEKAYPDEPVVDEIESHRKVRGF